MKRKFEIINKNNLPDEAQIKGFTFLKEPSQKDQENNKYDFINKSNNFDIGCMLHKRKSYALSKGYVKLDNTINDYVEVKSRWFILPIILICLIVCLLLAYPYFSTPTDNPVSNKPEIEYPIGNFEVTDKQQEKEKEPVEVDDTKIKFAGYGKYTISADSPNIELKNPEGNFVDMVFTLKDKASGEIIARTGKVSAGSFIYVNVKDFYTETGTYDVQISISTSDSKSGKEMNGLNQEMQVTVK